MSRRATWGGIGGVALAACLLAACSLGLGSRADRRGGGGPQELRIWLPPIVWWDAAGDREVALALENTTNQTIEIAAPDPANARVEVFAGPESLRVCAVEPTREPKAGEPVALAPGDRVAVHVDLSAECAHVRPGEYRVEVGYRSPELPEPAPAPADGAADAARGDEAHSYSGTLATAYGQIFVETPSRDAAGRAAQLRTR